MNIIAHRGFWEKPGEKNTFIAFKKALDAGYGIEFDIRDYKGKLVIAHSIAVSSSPELYEVFSRLAHMDNFYKVIFAINIKCDSIESKVFEFIKNFKIIKNSFVFDMSFPSTYIFYRFYKNLNIAVRQSEFETSPLLYSQSKWLWLDEFQQHWITNRVIIKHIKNGKKLCIVSPELHGRKHEKIWRQYLQLPKEILRNVYLCTDFPEQVDFVFNANKYVKRKEYKKE